MLLEESLAKGHALAERTVIPVALVTAAVLVGVVEVTATVVCGLGHAAVTGTRAGLAALRRRKPAPSPEAMAYAAREQALHALPRRLLARMMAAHYPDRHITLMVRRHTLIEHILHAEFGRPPQ